ncbi:vesicle-associated protein 2-2-like [Ipomoea triloba]|uniref:vesicle-associated protein 2-2-like n=1 Tax=Ipomoea triloba TaxID=35885 RepID=UPI00125E1605|nr:vesicle-associated protein 2-2-like [Ipomoea triloba]GLL37226.1 vesicle-associated protein 2-2-like isoform X2 [Ipomoea trifida]GMD46780.1 vesicle-associated protein 2-2-like [Ipomoea batatas]
MSFDLLDIIPRDVKFIFESRKQSTSTIRLANKSDKDVAFKVKTTNPKKYSVRPNAGVLSPKSSCDFTITMQAQREPPPDMICKDKFLVQGATVPEGTTEEDITSEMFAKDDGKYVQENKLRVILVNPSDSPVLSPMNGVHSHQARNVFADDVFGSAKFSALSEENGKELVDTKLLESKSRKDIEELESFKEVMKSKLNELELQLSAAEATIARLTEERKEIARERESLQRELAIMTSKKVVKKVHVGFPLMYVVMVAVFSLTIGCLLRRL